MRELRSNRVSNRVPTNIPVNAYESVHSKALMMHAKNISDSGIFLSTALEFGIGEQLICSFTLPGSDSSLAILSEVVRSSGTYSAAPILDWGVGMRFIDDTLLSNENINHYIQEMNNYSDVLSDVWFV